ncbi:MAG: ribonuclease HII [Gemmatimonadaceae bacterium]
MGHPRARNKGDDPGGDEKRRAHFHAPKRWTAIEKNLRRQYGDLLAGVDEVGRGPLAGPVVACAVIMPAIRRAIAGVDDSKVLGARERERLALRIRERALAVSLGAASVREIDRFNIYRASVLAMRRALDRLGVVPQHVLVDGNRITHFAYPHTAVVGGDARCYSVACASIIAKVTRDHLMAQLALRYPAFGWERNAGYATAEHLDALEAGRPTQHHRSSFLRVRQLLFDFAGPLAAAPIVDVAGPSDAQMGGMGSLAGVFLDPDQAPPALEKH